MISEEAFETVQVQVNVHVVASREGLTLLDEEGATAAGMGPWVAGGFLF